ncbi:MAG TPA: glycosyltransferase, partial [Candidatus Saccharimonadales bacterium]|nr:glycosyltransferase [Candidatus Saccharimonadales bacterium]
AWFGFNNLAAYRGLWRRRRGKTDKVYYWAVDFVANRFGKGFATKVYDHVDKTVCQKADGRAELSSVGVTSRNRYHHLKASQIAPTQVIPMGAWLDRTPKVSAGTWDKKKLVYLGHLVERQGVQNLIKAAKILQDQGQKFSLEIVGAGPLSEELMKMSKDLGLDKLVKFHGFVKDHKDVEAILASGMLAVAPYKKEKNFVQFTDAGKLKAYLGAGLPIVLTDVPNNAQELKSKGVAYIAEDDPKDLANVIASLLNDKQKWQSAHKAVQQVAKEFDWNIILERALKNFGFE